MKIRNYRCLVCGNTIEPMVIEVVQRPEVVTFNFRVYHRYRTYTPVCKCPVPKDLWMFTEDDPYVFPPGSPYFDLLLGMRE